ncbi:MAG: hypothetical protein JWN29_2175, partial [Acidimicrobiales bacterium]|nr:hypothetical protein [Acidimicrobiales bacterium]
PFGENTPLFLYILREAELMASGHHLGPVGGRVVGEVFVGLLRNDPTSYLSVDPSWTPAGGSGYRMANFLTDAGVAGHR